MGARLPRCSQSSGQSVRERVAVVPEPAAEISDFLSLGPGLLEDPEFRREFEQLTTLSLLHPEHGVRLNDLLTEPLRHPVIIRWQRCSNEVLASMKARKDLLRKRRWDVLRWLSGPDVPMPYTKPEFAYLPEHRAVVNRVLRLRDEGEWLVIPTMTTPDPRMPWRPVREVLTHDLVRGLLDWKASHLDLYLSAYPHLIGGRICHELPAGHGSKRQHIHEVKFSTVPFMRWYFANMN